MPTLSKKNSDYNGKIIGNSSSQAISKSDHAIVQTVQFSLWLTEDSTLELVNGLNSLTNAQKVQALVAEYKRQKTSIKQNSTAAVKVNLLHFQTVDSIETNNSENIYWY